VQKRCLSLKLMHIFRVRTVTPFLNEIIIIQFNSILIYLRANLTAQRPITKWARVTRTNKIQNKEVYTVMIVIIIIIIICLNLLPDWLSYGKNFSILLLLLQLLLVPCLCVLFPSYLLSSPPSSLCPVIGLPTVVYLQSSFFMFSKESHF
jgi:hypothetical protein